MKSPDQGKVEVLTIAQVKAMPDGAIVSGVLGSLKRISPMERRSRPDGTDYAAQHFTLWDGTDEIDGTAYDQNDLAYWPPIPIVMMSKKSRNGRYGGVSVHAEMPGGSVFQKRKLSATLRVSKAAVILSEGTVNAQ